jgi:predicted O-methyltransferase YrrM
MGRGYVPPVYAFLTDEEWAALDAWYSETDTRFSHTGECNVPAISLIHGLIMGSAIRRVVQLGHFVGYSTLLLGFMMRHMGRTNAVFSVDISEEASAYTRGWVARTGLDEQVRIHVSDSAAPEVAAAASAYLSGQPDVVFIDSSHGYAHTLKELDLWYGEVRPGGLILMHDASEFAAQFDPDRAGGVPRALDEWVGRHGVRAMLLNADAKPGIPGEALVYGDPCGLGLIQKPFDQR